MAYLINGIIILIALIGGGVTGFNPTRIFKKKSRYMPLISLIIFLVMELLVRLLRNYVYDNFWMNILNLFFTGGVIGSLIALFIKKK